MTAMAAKTMANMKAASPGGTSESLGIVRIVDTPYGLAFYPQLSGLRCNRIRFTKAQVIDQGQLHRLWTITVRVLQRHLPSHHRCRRRHQY